MRRRSRRVARSMRCFAACLALAGLGAGVALAAESPRFETTVLSEFAHGNPVDLAWATRRGTPFGSERLFVLDAAAGTVTRYTATGEPEKTFGGFGAGPGELANPQGLAADVQGQIYVADTGNDRIQVFDFDGGFVRSIGSSGNGDGQFSGPRAIYLAAFDEELVVADTGNDRVLFLRERGPARVEPIPSPIALGYATYGGTLVSSRGLGAIRTLSGGARGLRPVPGIGALPEGKRLGAAADFEEHEERVYLADADRARIVVLSEQLGYVGSIAMGTRPPRAILGGHRSEIDSLLVADGERVVELGFVVDSPVPVFQELRRRLAKRDVEGALELFHPASRATFREIYHDLYDDLPAAAEEMANFRVDSIKEHRAKLRIERVEIENGKQIRTSHPVTFVRGRDGEWLILDY